ncbi:MAG: hypothetical protein E4H10_05090 [Bacteroidia bacterium]|nr:MAG: hypothetical protein E4H10_05090 [Bacteroidia bacterium]
MSIRKLIFVGILAILAMVLTESDLKAQSNWEIGGRFGPEVALDMTIPLAKAPRLHPTVYLYDHFALGTYFDWLFAIQDGPSGLKFYPGVGPEFYFYNGFDLGVAGDFGAEYSFEFPLTIGFDWRPGFMLTDGFYFYGNNWGIFARFRFGEGVKFVKAN